MFFIVALDQVTKYIAVKKLMNQPRKTFGPMIFLYVKNYGGAMGFMRKKPWLIKWFSVVLLVIVSYLFLTSSDWLHRFALITIIGGGMGNVLDRFTRGYVVDFYSFKIKKLPYFNIADFFVIMGCLLLMIVELNV
ncbi:signal peptidase II [Acidaminobacter sp. JC074]|uniref:signal peptidase II n=1 Tax=Acidaminobacter sp. JC074 TaxID=2530199 RepID=UPI001F0E6B8E|nr:signal peptidase II [Acidaminobacter sp. JC074]